MWDENFNNFFCNNAREILKNPEIRGIPGRLKYEAEKLLESKQQFSKKIVNDVQAASQEVVEELDIKGLVKWLLNRYLSAFGFFKGKEFWMKWPSTLRKYSKERREDF